VKLKERLRTILDQGELKMKELEKFLGDNFNYFEVFSERVDTDHHLKEEQIKSKSKIFLLYIFHFV